MNFISLDYWLFFALSAGVYYLLRGRVQLGWLVGCSVLFYCFYKPAFLAILATQLAVDYVSGRLIEARPRWGRAWLLASICSNLALLVSFKYLAWLLGLAGYSFAAGAIVPLGLSFHTFQGIAYTTDVYRGQVRAERNFLAFCNYIFFFPQLVAGPIERPGHFMPQIKTKRFTDENLVAGGRLILWGLVQKMIVADRLALLADPVFARQQAFSAPATWLGVVAFSIQILADFSGYTDIARGCARILGYELSLNFRNPYAARTFGEFWHRWHISLSSWFRDYVYIPLGGSRVGVGRWALNILVVFGLSGLWHGAQTTFLIWGLMHGLFLIAERGLRAPAWLSQTYTLLGVGLAWVFFRAASLSDAGAILAGLWRPFTLQGLAHLRAEFPAAGNLALTLGLAALYQAGLVLRPRLEPLLHRATPLRWAGYYAATAGLLLLTPVNNPVFIYFQF